MLEHPLWQKVFAACRPVYKIPTRCALSSTLLENEYSEMKKQVSEIVLSAPHLHLQCDGWTNIRNNGIINFVLSTPRPVFVKSVPTGQNRHTAEYISDEVNKVLIEFNPTKFITLIGDNAANVQKSFMMLQNVYPHLVPLNCLAHSINLLFNDIVCLQSLIDFKSDSLSIVKTINRSQILKASLETINKEQNILCSLKLPSPTRWASFFYCLESLNSTKFGLQILAVREQTLSTTIKKLLLDDSGFWVNVENCINLLKPMVKCITLLESDSCNIHNVYKYIKEIETCLNKTTDSSLLSTTDSSKMCVIFQKRKANMIKPIHLAATVLNPSDQGTSLSSEEYIDANEFIYNISKARGLNTNIIMSELANYKTKSSGFWLKNYLWESANSMEPLVWWNGLCSFSVLSSLATSILSAPTTSAATERSFSTYGNIHTKKRNKLTCDRAGKITYISHNWKLINNNPKPKTLKLICASSTLTSSLELNDMPMPLNINENSYETVEDEENTDDESFVIPYTDDETSECVSESEVEVEFLTFDDLETQSS